MTAFGSYNGEATLPRADAVPMKHVASMPASGWIMTDNGPVPVLRANIDLAGFTGSADLIAAVSGKTLALVSAVIAGGGNSLAYFLDGAGTSIFGGTNGKIQLSTTPFVLPVNNHFWMRGGVSQAIRINLASSVSLGGVVQYVQL